MWRAINWRLFVGSGLAYRASVMGIQTMFLWMVTGELKFSLGTSATWGIVNMAWYYVYHGVLYKTHRLGK